MGSQGSGDNNIVGNQTRDPESDPFTQQGSLYNLTFDEVQSQLGDLGKPLGSMNLDELLRTVSTVEADGHANGDLNRQSSLTLSRDFSKKTVDEVWHHIQQEQSRSSLDRKETLGEITLEDFLVKAGIVAESAFGKENPGPVQGQWVNYPMQNVYVPGQHQVPVGGNVVMDGSLSDAQVPGRKRAALGDVAEKGVERRKKRMIKNRESAARSRARRQAYTHELENKVSLLEEENERLKKQKDWETTLHTIPQPDPKHQLRRTSSAPV